MKQLIRSASIRFAAIAATFTAAVSFAAVVIPSPVSSLSLAPGTGGGISLTLTNNGDQVWMIQSSPNMSDWTKIDAWKVHNGLFHRTYPVGPNNNQLFYRAVYDPTTQDLFSTVEAALRLPATSINYAAPILPPSFSVQPILGQDNMPATNITTDAGATLGRVLFYDKRLSTNQSISCSSCHQQAHGFSDGKRFSTGFNGGLTGRNSMGLSNARWYLRRHFFWDERANTLEDQVLQPIQNAVEMGMTLDALTNRLGSEPYYSNLFNQAFGTPEVTSQRISLALAQFVRSIVSTRSKYDAGVAVGFTNFTQQENQGRGIFFGPIGNCAACHGTDNFVPGPTINNNGLENPYVDKGVGALTGLPRDEGLFKVPSLRNIELTAPYMHDGRFSTLEEVVEFYNSGVVNHPNLSPPLRVPTPPGQPPGPPRRLNLTPEQKVALIAFLKTLTDTNLVTDPKLSDPFNYGN